MNKAAKKYYEIHKRAFEVWSEGEPVEIWNDENGILCIRYESGRWWHYKPSPKGLEWW